MLRLQKEERQVAALIDQEEPVLPAGVRARDDGAPAAEREGKPPAAALLACEQVRTRLAGDQIGALGVGEDHLAFGDLLEFREHRAQALAAAGFVGALGFAPPAHSEAFRTARGLSGELNVSAVVIMMPPMATAVVARNQSSVFAKRDLISGHRILRALTELISDAANGLDHRPRAFQLPAQMADVHVDGAVERRGFAVVEALHQSVARNHVAGVSHQLFQNIEFQRCDLDRLAVAELPRACRDRAPRRSLPAGRGSPSASVRRRMALTRAASSRGLNGFGR